MEKRSGRKEVAISAGGAGGANPLLLRGARTIRTLSARYIPDLQDDWEIHGKAALAGYREKFVDRYVENYAMLARIIRVEADVKHSHLLSRRRWKKLSRSWRARSAPKAAASLRSSCARWRKIAMRTRSMLSRNKASLTRRS